MSPSLRWCASLTAVVVAAIACATPANGQITKVHRVAYISGVSPLSELKGADPISPAARAFVHGLRDLGYVEGRNLVLDFRTLEGRVERIPEVLAEIVRFKPDVIFSSTQIVVERHLQATAGIPIVTLASWSLVQPGIAQSLARPGGTVTGFIMDVDSQVEAKRLELLREAIPGIKRIAYLGLAGWLDSPAGKSVVGAAQRLGLTLFDAAYTGLDIQAAFAIIARERPDAVLIPLGASSFGNRQRFGQFVSAKRLPCVAGFREIVEHGCLMSYGTDNSDVLRRAAGYVAKILEGAKPGELPIQQPTKFELVINLKEAKALGLKFPQSILLRADSVIE
jgi:putative ABC transport system substrate-binding protein